MDLPCADLPGYQLPLCTCLLYTSWFHEPDQIGMESAWNKIRFNKTFGELTEWDFNQYTPQVVVVAIGQNDNHPFDYMSEDYMCEKAILWREHYTEFLKKLRQVYPKASVVCCTTLLEHDSSWDKAIDDVVAVSYTHLSRFGESISQAASIGSRCRFTRCAW